MGFATLSNSQVLLAFFSYTIAYLSVVGYNFHADTKRLDFLNGDNLKKKGKTQKLNKETNK